jgi:secreted trypsin-like serine protease
LKGDSGGPLIQDDGTGRALLVGISSWSRDCASVGIPGVYVEVSFYRDWIDANAV